MATQDTAALLAQLRDIHLPPAPAEPSVWPSVAAILLFASALILFLLKKHRRKASWSDEAIKELNNIQNMQPDCAVHRTAALLKRIVLTHDPSVRHQTGEQWLRSLDHFFSTDYFSRGNGRLFGHALYTDTPAPPEKLYQDIQKLIRKRKRQQ